MCLRGRNEGTQRSGDVPSEILNLGTRWVWSPSHPDLFSPEQGVPRRLAGLHSRFGPSGEGTKSLASARNPTTIPQSSNLQPSPDYVIPAPFLVLK